LINKFAIIFYLVLK